MSPRISAPKPRDPERTKRVNEQLLVALKEMMIDPNGFLVRSQAIAAIVAAEALR